MDYSNPNLIMLRRIGQRLRIFTPLVRIWRKVSGSAYEEAFDNYVISRITPGSIVWDIGANVGFFTEKFSVATGESGKVVAFDPSPGCVEILNNKFSDTKSVIVEPLGLSDSSATADFSAGDSTDVTGGLGKRPHHNNVIKVDVTTGDVYAESHKVVRPNYIKIDVEGYELEVLKGMPRLLEDKNLKGIFIEVHFLQLANRNLSKAPNEIVNMLNINGFTTRWIDPSHLVGERS